MDLGAMKSLHQHLRDYHNLAQHSEKKAWRWNRYILFSMSLFYFQLWMMCWESDVTELVPIFVQINGGRRIRENKHKISKLKIFIWLWYLVTMFVRCYTFKKTLLDFSSQCHFKVFIYLSTVCAFGCLFPCFSVLFVSLSLLSCVSEFGWLVGCLLTCYIYFLVRLFGWCRRC